MELTALRSWSQGKATTSSPASSSPASSSPAQASSQFLAQSNWHDQLTLESSKAFQFLQSRGASHGIIAPHGLIEGFSFPASPLQETSTPPPRPPPTPRLSLCYGFHYSNSPHLCRSILRRINPWKRPPWLVTSTSLLFKGILVVMVNLDILKHFFYYWKEQESSAPRADTKMNVL